MQESVKKRAALYFYNFKKLSRLNSLGKIIYLSFDYTVYDGFQGFIGIALDHPLNKTRAPVDGLLHGHVQIVVGLLGC